MSFRVRFSYWPEVRLFPQRGAIIDIDVSAPESEILAHINEVGDTNSSIEREMAELEKSLGLESSNFLTKAFVLSGQTVDDQRKQLDKFKRLSPEVHLAMKGRAIWVSDRLSERSRGRLIEIDVNAPNDKILAHIKKVGGEMDAIEQESKELAEKLGLKDGSLTRPLAIGGDTVSEKRKNLDHLKKLSPAVQQAMKGKQIHAGTSFGEPLLGSIVPIDVFAKENEILEQLNKYPVKAEKD